MMSLLSSLWNADTASPFINSENNAVMSPLFADG
jgi:hypothetical protein